MLVVQVLATARALSRRYESAVGGGLFGTYPGLVLSIRVQEAIDTLPLFCGPRLRR